jgi:hypothetical protein
MECPRPGQRSTKTLEPVSRCRDKQKAREDECREKRRMMWLDQRREWPHSSVTEIRGKCYAGYTWLYRNDIDWLRQHSPSPSLRPDVQRCQVNWNMRDRILVDICVMAAYCIILRQGKPKLLSRTSVCSGSGYYPVIVQHPGQLPLTTWVLSQIAETRLEFALRRIEWAAQEFFAARIAPERWQLVRRSGTGRIMDHPEISETLDETVRCINKSVHRGVQSYLSFGISEGLLDRLSLIWVQSQSIQLA